MSEYLRGSGRIQIAGPKIAPTEFIQNGGKTIEGDNDAIKQLLIAITAI